MIEKQLSVRFIPHHRPLRRRWAMAAVAWLPAVIHAADIGTAFTYQGHLENPPGTPVTDTCNFEFTLWDDPISVLPANQVGGIVSKPLVGVVSGDFTIGPPDVTGIDFGIDAIDGTARWMQVSVDCPSIGGGLTALGPRVELAPAPHALALPGLYTQQNGTSPNLIGGYSGNIVVGNTAGATISGGGDALFPNTAGAFDTVGGGSGNTASSTYSTVGGGHSNTAGDNGSSVGGGYYNIAGGGYSSVGGGLSNAASGGFCAIGGGQSNVASERAGAVGGGEGNVASADWSTIGGGKNNDATKNYATIGGGEGNHASEDHSTVSGGASNEASGLYATIGGGQFNAASADDATVPGGKSNAAGGSYSFAAGRLAKVRTAAEVGGSDLDGDEGTFVWADSTEAPFTSTGPNQFLIRAGGGVGIGITDPSSPLTVGGIVESRSGGFKFPDGSTQETASVGGGAANTLDMAYDQGGPGAGRTITADAGAVEIGGPDGLAVAGTITSGDSIIIDGAGVPQTIKSSDAIEFKVAGDRVLRLEPEAIDWTGYWLAPNLIGGWWGNTAAAAVVGATIAGGGSEGGGVGYPNTVTKDFGTVGGGYYNSAGEYAVVGGGGDNGASGSRSTVAGGHSNRASDRGAVVGGGEYNKATSWYAMVPGGYESTAGGSHSFAAGYKAKVRDAAASLDGNGDEGTFVWADTTSTDFTSTGPNQFLIRATGGVRLATGDGATPQFQAILPSTDTPDDLALNALGGNVGIGTLDPTHRLDVKGKTRIRPTGNTNLLISDGGVANSDDVSLDLVKETNTTSSARILFDGWTSPTVHRADIRFFTRGPADTALVERMRIAESGNISIGPTTPTSPLAVAGIVESKSGGFRFPDGTIQTTAGGGGSGGWTDDGAGVRLTTPADQVGIGTSAPGMKLEVKVTGSNGVLITGDGTGDTRLAMANAGGTHFIFDDTLNSHALKIESAATRDIAFNTNGPEERMRITSAGNVGIGTTNPGTELEVVGGIQASGTITSGSSLIIDGTAIAGAHSLSSNLNLEFRASGWRALRLEGGLSSPNLIGGDFTNSVTFGTYGAAIGGGARNHISDHYGTVCGGENNQAGTDDLNPLLQQYATVGGGKLNSASGEFATVSGGDTNIASGAGSTVSGGGGNTAAGSSSTVGGGFSNDATESDSTVSGGTTNTASGPSSTVGGGWTNTASGESSTVGGGAENTATAKGATVGGGNLNHATGLYATVPGGTENFAGGVGSFAAGKRASAFHDNTFVWSDGPLGAGPFLSTGPNQFLIKASGGTKIFSDIGATVGVELPAGGSAWSVICDRELKENFAPVDGQEILQRLSRVPITEWNLKSQQSGIRHIGPVAQDFHAAFGLGESDRRISTVDADGVAFAAIQGLYDLVQEKDCEISELKEHEDRAIDALGSEISHFKSEISDLKALVKALADRNGSGQ